jgi:hypothetical protein
MEKKLPLGNNVPSFIEIDKVYEIKWKAGECTMLQHRIKSLFFQFFQCGNSVSCETWMDAAAGK